MMRIRRTVACLPFLAMSLLAAPAALAAGGNPSIQITNLHNGSVVTGNAITVDVAVQHFKLVPPVYLNPPKLTGNQGHIHYVLDSLANFQPRRDATISLSHTWTGVTPGAHTVEAYLATSQHAQFANAEPVKVSITVKAAAAGPTATPSTSPGVSTAPTSGGAAGQQSSPLPVEISLVGLLAILAGALLLSGSVMSRRMEK